MGINMTNSWGQVTDNTKQLAEMAQEWTTWEPTIIWAIATPADVTTIARYKTIGKTVFFLVYISATDGNNAFGFQSITLPAVPKTNNINPMINTMHAIGTTITTRMGYIRDDGINNDMQIYTNQLTDGSAIKVYVSGMYEIA
jgi:ABC-type uncharacterized transport system substrate-binding protein